MTHTAQMTREEILATAKVGGFALVRLEITKLRGNNGLSVCHPSSKEAQLHSLIDCIIAIEPPPQTQEQRIDALEACNKKLEERLSLWVSEANEGMTVKERREARIAELEALVSAKDARIAELESAGALLTTKDSMDMLWQAISGCGPIKHFDGVS